MKPDGSHYRIVHAFQGGSDDGAQPHHDLLRQEGDVLYGATLAGGEAGQGTVFSINADGTRFSLLHAFTGGGGDGAEPHSNPMPDGPVLYGLTSKGGMNGVGVIYQVNTDGTGYKGSTRSRTPTAASRTASSSPAVTTSTA